MAEQKEQAKTDAAAGGESKKKLNVQAILGVVLAVVNFGVIGGGLYMTYASTLGWNAPAITEEELVANRKLASEHTEEDVTPMIYTMDKFTVNLEGEPKRMIRLEVNLSMLNKEGFEEILDIGTKSKVRDRIVSLLHEKSFSDLESIQGKLFLKDQIALETNHLLPEGVVKDVFFSDFIVQ